MSHVRSNSEIYFTDLKEISLSEDYTFVVSTFPPEKIELSTNLLTTDNSTTKLTSKCSTCFLILSLILQSNFTFHKRTARPLNLWFV